MANKKGVIGILTGGGDVPGLNPAIRAVALRAFREGYRVIGIRRGWAGLVEVTRDKKADNSSHFIELNEDIVDHAGRTGGTFLHSSRTNLWAERWARVLTKRTIGLSLGQRINAGDSRPLDSL